MTGTSDMDSICISAIVVERLVLLQEGTDHVLRRNFLDWFIHNSYVE
jgi:hypothetical protein